jgi:heme/copper-type cytochrome/quinol oxidase subunit 4
MVKINPINVLTMLINSYKTSKTIETQINAHKTELKDHLKGMIISFLYSIFITIFTLNILNKKTFTNQF